MHLTAPKASEHERYRHRFSRVSIARPLRRAGSFVLLTSLLLLAACGIRIPFFGGERLPDTSSLSIQAAPKSKPKIQTAVHPLAPEFESGEGGSADDLPMERFFLHQVHEGQINALAVSDDGARAFSGGQDGKVVLSTIVRPKAAGAETKERKIKTETLLSGSKPVLALALSPDQKKLLVSQFSLVVVYDLERRVVTNVLTRVKGRILALAWDPRGELVALARASGDVFVWNLTIGDDAGENSERALESYLASTSPITALAFHPSGRAFFAAERDGSIWLWRLLRTERELGLRDEGAEADKTPAGRTVQRVAFLPALIEDVWLNQSGSDLFVATADGYVRHWKVRGLKDVNNILVGTDSVFSVRGIQVEDPDGGYRVVPLLVTSGRGQRLKFWCREPVPTQKTAASAIADVVVQPEEKPEEPRRASDEDEFDIEVSPKAEPSPPVTRPGFVGQSMLFRTPLVLLRGGERYPLLWAAEKTGSLLTFDADSLLRHDRWRARAERCEG